MCTIVLHDDVRIPDSIEDLQSFRQWAKSDDYPETGRFSFLDGEVWVDVMAEQLFTHNRVKTEFTTVLNSLLKKSAKGTYFSDGALLTNSVAGLSTEPDGTVVLFESIENGTVELIQAAGNGFVEIAGSPDIVLEVVSKGSVRKDTVVLRELYWQAGIREYWLVDARGDEPSFDILTHGDEGFEPAPQEAGWAKSAVLEHKLRLIVGTDPAGNPDFELQFD